MRRNILLITVDQWRGECLEHLGHPLVRTPALSRLAAEGVTFRRHFAQGAPCAPSRMSIYAGRYVFNHRVVSNETPIDPHVPTLPRYLRAHGYEPWVSGYTSTIWSPEGRAARDPLLTEPSIGPDWSILRAFDGDRRRYLEDLHARGYPRWDSYDGIFAGTLDGLPDDAVPASPVDEAHGETAWLVDAAIDHIRYVTDRPWAVHLSIFKPHPPFVPSERFAAMAREMPAPPLPKTFAAGSSVHGHPFMRLALDHMSARALWPGLAGRAADLSAEVVARMRRAYYAICAEVDHQLGRLFDALEQTGALDETLIVFTADHAELLGDYGLFGKHTVLPEATHVPLIVRDPSPAADGRRGTTVGDFTEGVDILPTIMGWLGAPADAGWDGRPLLPYLHGAPIEDPRREAFFEFDFRNHPRERSDRHVDAALDPRRRCAATVISDDSVYIHFPGLEGIAFTITEADGLRYVPATGIEGERIRHWGLAVQLDRRMTYGDNRRTAFVSTRDGIERRH